MFMPVILFKYHFINVLKYTANIEAEGKNISSYSIATR